MKVILVEDDYLQAEWIATELREQFPGLELEVIATELDFRQRVPAIVKEPPNVVIMDVMIRWTDPSQEMPDVPDDVKGQGPYRAGLRCQQLLSAANASLPVILYTVLEQSDLKDELPGLPENVLHLRKESNLDPLFQIIRKYR